MIFLLGATLKVVSALFAAAVLAVVVLPIHLVFKLLEKLS